MPQASLDIWCTSVYGPHHCYQKIVKSSMLHNESSVQGCIGAERLHEQRRDISDQISPVCYAKAVYTLDPASSRAASGSDCSGLSSHAVLPEIMCSGDIS